MEELYNLKKAVNVYSSLAFKVGLTIVILTTFFLFTNLFTESYDFPKLLILLIFTLVLLIVLALRFIVSGKVVLTRTPLDIPLLLLLAVGVVSTFLSPAPYVSLLGNQLRVHGSLISLITYVLFYFVLVNNLKDSKEIRWLFTIAVAASQILAVATLLSYFGIKILPASLNPGLNFTPTGSSFSTAAILALLLPFILVQILSSHKSLFIALNSLFLLITGVTIALTGTWATWVAALIGIGLGLTLFISNLSNLSNLRNLRGLKALSLICLIAPLALIALVTVLSFIPPMGNAKNPLYTQSRNFPREAQLPFVTSWKISVSAFRDLPFWGSGPSSYLFNFTNYKPVEFNSSKIWNLRFDSSFNEYLQTLATLGGVGVIALLSITALFISSAYKTISQARHQLEGVNQMTPSIHLPGRLKTALAISGIIFFVLLALHASSLPVLVTGLIVLAAFMRMNISEETQRSWNGSNDFKNMFMRIAAGGGGANAHQEIKVDALPGILLAVVVVLTLFTGYTGGKIVLADYHHKLALNAVGANNGITAYNELIAAEKLNPYNDLYRTDLAQTNFALANAIAAAKGPTEASPGGSLTDQDKQNIQVLLSQSIAEGRTAVTLSPKSALNWEILALLYRQIAGVAQNALVFSLDSYGKAIFQDPLNPTLRVSVGGVYYAVKNYDMAIRFFTDAVNIKPDYANAYYNLSVTLRDKGDLTNAQVTAEKVLTLLDPSSQDYKTANDYLTDLKNKIAEGAAAQNEAQPPAAQTTGALQNQELPKVIDLPKPEKIATPEAIKKPLVSPSPTTEPTSTPAPTATP